MAKVRYEEMLPHEAVEARMKCPVAYLPIGGIEWHGEHNCLGLDTVKIHAIAMKCAENMFKNFRMRKPGAMLHQRTSVRQKPAVMKKRPPP